MVTLAPSALETIVAHAREAAPRECCGVLIGAGTRILEAVRSENLANDPNRFLVDPHTHIAARRNARARGQAVLGFYHSHPHSGAVPSATDLAEASYSDHLYVIVSLNVEPPDLRVYRLEHGNFRAVALVTGT